MELRKIEKAMEQAEASLKVDRIYLRPEFLTSYRIKKGIPINKGPQLVIKRSVNNASKQ